MRQFRKTGVRSPFLPSPIVETGAAPPSDMLRPVIVVGAIVPVLLLGSMAQPTLRPALPEDIAWPARPAVVVQQPGPVPGANGYSTFAPRDQPVVQPDHTWPVAPLAGQQPIPVASFWMPSPARLPNTDPRRPPIVVADPPDSTLAQPSTLLIGRLPRNEDTSRPARPLIVQPAGAQPIPNAHALWIGIVRDVLVVAPDRLAQTQVVPGVQPQPSGRAYAVGIVHDGDRLPLGAIVHAPQPPVSGAQTRLIGGPRDAAHERLAIVRVIGATAGAPGGATITLAPPREAPTFVVGAPIVLTLDARASLLHLATRDGALSVRSRSAALALASRTGSFSLRERSTVLTITTR